MGQPSHVGLGLVDLTHKQENKASNWWISIKQGKNIIFHKFQIEIDQNSEFIKNTKNIQHKPRNAYLISDQISQNHRHRSM